MGADFSGVRFHNDASAARNADSIDAHAYTTGRDVFFNSGGFDPELVAHELVHTAQQGAVDSGVSVTAAPMGAVQMDKDADKAKKRAKKLEEEAKKREKAIAREQDPEYDAAAEKKGFFGGLARRAASPFKFLGRKFKLDKAAEAIGRKVTGKTGFDDSAKRLAAETTESTPETAGDAARFGGAASTDRREAFKASPFPTLIPTLAGVAADTGVNTVGAKLAGGSQFGGLTELADGKMTQGIGSVGGIVGGEISAFGGVMGTMQNALKADTSRKGGNTSEAAQSALATIGSIGSAASGVAKTVGYMGAGTGAIAGGVLPGLSVATGGAQVAKGTVGAISGARAQRRMSKQVAKLTADKTASAEDSMGFSDQQRQSMMRSMHMAREMGAINKEAGIGEAIAGGLTAAGGVATLSGAGAMVGTVLGGVGTGLGALSGFNKSVQVEDMRRRVVDQELGMTDKLQKLDQELAQRGESEKYDKATKEKIILQRMGYNSGTKNEVFMNIAMNRSKMMTDMANASTADVQGLRKADPNADSKKKRLKGEEKYDWTGKDDELKQYRQRKFARETLKGMGLSKVKLDDGSSGYAQQGAAEKLGMDAGVDIHHQLADSRKGKSSADVLDAAQLKAEGQIAEYSKKKDKAWFGWTRDRHDKKLKEAQAKKAALDPAAHQPKSDVTAPSLPKPGGPIPLPGLANTGGSAPTLGTGLRPVGTASTTGLGRKPVNPAPQPPLADVIARQKELLKRRS
jgi:hypothetical protein